MPDEVRNAVESSRDKQKKSAGAEERGRKERILKHGVASTTQDISDAVVIKDGNLFFLAQQDGSVPLEEGHGLGLYYHDCRYLNGYQLKLAGGTPMVLVATAIHGFEAIFQLTNPDIRMNDGSVLVKESIGIKWVRTISGENRALYDVISFQNFTLDEVELAVSLTFNAAFEDIFEVRGIVPEKIGKLVRTPVWDGNALSFIYKGADGIYRSLAVQLTPTPHQTDGKSAHLRIKLPARASKEIVVWLNIAESARRDEVDGKSYSQPNMERVRAEMTCSRENWLHRNTEIISDSFELNQALARALDDVRMLRSRVDAHDYVAAGVPWFVTLFGRDSIITALQVLAFDRRIAEETLRVLAHYQGSKTDQTREEQPGKIPHELRVGELAHTGEVPYTPYYGTVDATPLFLILLGRYAAWTGTLALFDELQDNVARALDWIEQYGDSDADGYVDYESRSKHGLANQGWKDSGDAIVNADGSLARPPIALVEVQGYVYLAKTLMAKLYRRAGDARTAKRLEEEAEALRGRFNCDYWMEEKGAYMLALQANRQPAAVVSSNAGQALWSGIAQDDKARRTAQTLMAEDMFSGWGVRTLSSNERRYNPVAYHLGTVWPHDNAIIAAGLRRYGCDEAVHSIFEGILQAATNFNHYRLPELFAGFHREEYEVPVRYPVACHPQAWGAGAIPYLLENMLGVEPDAFEQQLRIVRPILPDYVDHMTVRGLCVGAARVDLQFERKRAGVSVRTVKVEGALNVEVESG